MVGGGSAKKHKLKDNNYCLYIGGAERLIVDLALCLVRLGYNVTIYTPYFDPKRCFAECNEGIFKVKVAGD